MEVQAKAKWVRTSPRKVRLVARTLRNLPVSEALVACSFMPKAAARDVAKVIRSAQANAENNFNLVKDDLVIKDIRVEPGPMLKQHLQAHQPHHRHRRRPPGCGEAPQRGAAASAAAGRQPADPGRRCRRARGRRLRAGHHRVGRDGRSGPAQEAEGAAHAVCVKGAGRG